MIIKSQSMFQMEIYAEIAIPVILLIVYAVTGVVGELSSSFEVVKTYPKLPQAILLTFALFSSFSSVSSTSVSRQGALFFLDRTYPVPARTFVLAKVRLHLKYLCLSAQVYAFVTLVWMRLPLLHILWIAPLLLLLSFAVSCAGLAIDYHRPNLGWTLPQQAVKSNINTLFAFPPFSWRHRASCRGAVAVAFRRGASRFLLVLGRRRSSPVEGRRAAGGGDAQRELSIIVIVSGMDRVMG
jgi:hypothetical protein